MVPKSPWPQDSPDTKYSLNESAVNILSSRFLLPGLGSGFSDLQQSPLDFLPNKLLTRLLSSPLLAVFCDTRIPLQFMTHIRIKPFTSASYCLSSEKLCTSELFGYISSARYQESNNQDSTMCRQTFIQETAACSLLMVDFLGIIKAGNLTTDAFLLLIRRSLALIRSICD